MNEVVISIRGERTGLGPMRRDLIPTYTRWMNNLATLRNLSAMLAPLTVEAETRWFEGLAESGARLFTIYDLTVDPPRPIGSLDLRDINHRDRIGMFGISIGEPDARGKGHGTEATRLLLDYAFTVVGLHVVWLTVFSFNEAGIRCYQKAGFREVGRRRQCRLVDGVWHDEIYMDCLATEFQSPVLAALFAAAGDN